MTRRTELDPRQLPIGPKKATYARKTKKGKVKNVLVGGKVEQIGSPVAPSHSISNPADRDPMPVKLYSELEKKSAVSR